MYNKNLKLSLEEISVDKKIFLVAIHPTDKNSKGRDKCKSQYFDWNGDDRILDSAVRWITNHNLDLGYNIYFHCHQVQINLQEKDKVFIARPDQIIQANLIGLDFDVDATKPFADEQERLRRAKAVLLNSPFPPTHFLDSGGGMWAIWQCDWDIDGKDARDMISIVSKFLKNYFIHLNPDPTVGKPNQLMRLPVARSHARTRS